MSNLHLLLNEANKHDPKGFIPAINNTFPVKDEQGLSFYEERMSLPKAINFVDGTVAAPTTANGDIYVLIGAGVIDGSWGSATFGDWVRFNINLIPNPIVPLAGYLCYDTTAASWMEYDGSVWATFGGGVTNLIEGTTTNTAVDVNSDTGTNATLLAASTSRAGVMTKAKFDEVVLNNAKLTNATHTGEVTGSGALTVDQTAITNKPLVTANALDLLLISDDSNGGALKSIQVGDLLGVSSNLYTANGTLLSSRTVTMGANTLLFSGNQTTFKGIGNLGATKSFRAESLDGLNYFEATTDGSIEVKANSLAAFFKLGTGSASAGSHIEFESNSVAVSNIRAYGSGQTGIFQNALQIQSSVASGGILFRVGSSGDYKWLMNNGGADGSANMKLNNTGFMLGTGIGATAQTADVQFKGKNTAGKSLLFQDSNGIDRNTFFNNGSFNFASSYVGSQVSTLGNTHASHFTQVYWQNNIGAIASIYSKGSTAAAGGDPLLVGAYSIFAHGSASRFNLIDGSGGGMYFGTGNAATDANTDMKLTSAGLVLGQGIGDITSFPVIEQVTLHGRAFVANSTAPATPTGGGVFYVESGAFKYIGSSGTITTLGVA